MFSKGCMRVYRSGSLNLIIYCLMVLLLASIVYGQDTPGQAEKAAAAGDIAGKLSDSETGEWISGATVTINSSPPTSTTTGKYGDFRLSADAPDYGEKDYTLTITVKDGDPYLPTEVPVTVKCSEVVYVNIKLEAVPMIGKIEGTVKSSPWGVGIVQIEIILLKDGAQVGSTFTDQTGAYSFDDLEPGEYAVAVWAENINFESGYTDGVEVVGLKTTIVDFNLRRLMRGSVIDKDTLSNITGATVRIIDQETESTTDAEGKFELVVEDSDLRIHITKNGYNPGIFDYTISVENVNDPPMILGLSPVEDPNLPNPGSIAGAVMTPGEFGGTSNVKIEVYSGGNLVGTEYTDVNGQYKFESLQPGTYRVVATTILGKQIGERDGIVVESNGLRIVGFTGMPTFQGFVVDGSTGDPLNGATVMEMPSDVTYTTGPDGVFYFDFDTFGSHDFVVSHDGHNTELLPDWIIEANTIDPPTINLVPVPPGEQTPGSIVGKVTSNKPNFNVTYVTMKLYQGNTIIQETTPSKIGYYIFDVDAGTYSISADPPPPEIGIMVDNIEVEWDHMTFVDFGFIDPFSGYVLDVNTNHPLPGVDIILQPGGHQATTGDQGEFNFDIQETDDYDCFLSKKGYKPEVVPLTIDVTEFNEKPFIKLEPQTEGNGGVGIHFELMSGEDEKGGDEDVYGYIEIKGWNVEKAGTAEIDSQPLDERSTLDVKKDDIVISKLYNIPVTDPPVVYDVPLDIGNDYYGYIKLDVSMPEEIGNTQYVMPGGTATIPIETKIAYKNAGVSEIEYIKGAEYFMGDDPGQGNGTPMEAVDGLFDGEVEDVITSIDITGWEPGLKIFFMRTLYSDDTWSLIQSVGFYHEPITLKPPSNLTITDVENDNGYSLRLDWELSPDDAQVTSYRIYRSRSSQACYCSGFNFYESIEEIIEAELTSTINVGSIEAGVTTFLDETICVPGVDYYYWIQAQGEEAASKLASPGMITEVEETPLQFSVSKPYPNPFNPSVTIAYTLPERRMLSVVIYDILGRKIRVLDNTIREAGSYRLRWDGLDEEGLRAGSGIYLYRLRAGEFTQQGKMMLLR